MATLRLVLCRFVSCCGRTTHYLAEPRHTVPFLKALDADLSTLIALVAGPMDAGRSGYWSLGCWSLGLIDQQEKTDQRADHDPISAQCNSLIMNSPQGNYRASAIEAFT